MKLSAVGYQNGVSYRGNSEGVNPNQVAQPQKSDKLKKAAKYTGFALAGLAVLALVTDKGKSLGKIFNKLAGGVEKKGGAKVGAKAGEKVEELVPEVLDFDAVWGPRMAKRKARKLQPPRNIVIDEAGNILSERKKTGSMEDFLDTMRRQSERTNKRSAMDVVVDFLDDLTWFV